MKYRPMEESMIKKGNTYYPPKCPECYIFNSIHPELEWNDILKAWQCKWCGYEINHYHKLKKKR